MEALSLDGLGLPDELEYLAARSVERSSKELSESPSSSEFWMTRSDEIMTGSDDNDALAFGSEASLLGGGDKLEV